jgi:hypothetical protein
MKNKSIRTSLFACLSLLILVSSGCQKADEINPTITSILVNGESTDHPHATAGQAVVVSVVLEDNEDLGQVKLTMSGLDGHHDPDEEIALMQCPNVGEWPVLKITNLSGKRQEVLFELLCPDTIQGVWDVEIEVVDKSGNTHATAFPIHVQNDFLPYIGINTLNTALDENSVAHFVVGQSLVVTGEVLDQDGDVLSSVHCLLENNSGIVWEQMWTPSVWTFDLTEVVVPSFLETGTYIFTIHVTDNEGQVYWKTLDISVE